MSVYNAGEWFELDLNPVEVVEGGKCIDGCPFYEECQKSYIIADMCIALIGTDNRLKSKGEWV